MATTVLLVFSRARHNFARRYRPRVWNRLGVVNSRAMFGEHEEKVINHEPEPIFLPKNESMSSP